MNTAWLQQPWLETLGWTLVHSLWQLSLLAALVVIAFKLLRRQSAQVRYVVGYALLMAMMAVPVGTYAYLWTQLPTAPTASASTLAQNETENALPAVVKSIQLVPTEIISHQPAWQRMTQQVRSLTPYAALAYLLGASLLILRLLTGYGALRRVRIDALPMAGHETLLAQLCERLHVSPTVLLRQSNRVEVPTVIGIVRPMILLPLSTMTGLSTEHLTYLLLHELAHIRRHDYLANLAQSVVETLLFYHPAVVWLSAQVRQEREHCCDDLAIAATGNRRGYAAALASMESLRSQPAHMPGSLALGARGGSLLQRIRRILEVPTPRSIGQRIVSSSSLVVTVSILAFAVYLIGCSRTAEIPPAQTQAANTTQPMQFLAAPTKDNPETQIGVETRIEFVDDATYASLGLPPATSSQTANVVSPSTQTALVQPQPTPPPAFLNDSELSAFVQKFAESPASVQIPTPRLTLFNGQSGLIEIMQPHKYIAEGTMRSDENGSIATTLTPKTLKSGISMHLTAHVSADRRSVIMDFARLIRRLKGFENIPAPQRTGTDSAEFMVFIQVPLVDVTQLSTRVTIPNQTCAVFSGFMMKPNLSPSTEDEDKVKAMHLIFMVRPKILEEKQTENKLHNSPTTVP